MPTYEYVCDSCGHEFERFQPITAAPIRKCPKCTFRSVRRLITGGAGVIFKGSGFYQTDYRSKSYQEAAKKEAPEKKESSNEAPASGPTPRAYGLSEPSARQSRWPKGPEAACKQPKVCYPEKK